MPHQQPTAVTIGVSAHRPGRRLEHKHSVTKRRVILIRKATISTRSFHPNALFFGTITLFACGVTKL